jgi:hypothetical protein
LGLPDGLPQRRMKGIIRIQGKVRTEKNFFIFRFHGDSFSQKDIAQKPRFPLEVLLLALEYIIKRTKNQMPFHQPGPL